MTQQDKNLGKTAQLVEIDGEAAARKSGSDASEKAMQEISQEMSRLTPQERIKVAMKVQQINAERAEKDGSIPRAKVCLTKDGSDVAFIEFDPPTSEKVKESVALAFGASNPHGGRMRDTVVYQNPAEKKRLEFEAMDGQHGVRAAEQVLTKKLTKGGID